jgi:PAS domain S-box-containing protein
MLISKSFWRRAMPADLTKTKEALVAELDAARQEVAELKRVAAELRQAEEALRESEAFTRAVMDNLPIGIAVNSVGPTVNFEYMNENFPRIYRTTREELKEQDAFWEAVFEDPEFREEMKKRILDDCASGDPERMHWVDVPITRKGEKTRFISAQDVPLSEKGLLISTVFDVTDRKWAEKERELLNQELMGKNEELEQIVYVSSHDLRSPLVNIQGFSKELESCFQDVASALKGEGASSGLRQQLAPLINEDIPEALGFIGASVSKMDGLLSGLLKLSRLGRLAFVPKKLDMNKLLANVVAAHEFQLKESMAVFTLEELPPCHGDETQINQVFSNLFGNALKYLSSERPGRITVHGWKDKKNSVYCLADNGIGVPKGHFEEIFEIFRRLNPKENPGEGLGLAIVRRIIDRHQGTVWLESVPGEGSKFYVSLPHMPKA